MTINDLNAALSYEEYKKRRQAFNEAKEAQEREIQEAEKRREVVRLADARNKLGVRNEKLAKLGDTAYRTFLTEYFTQLTMNTLNFINEKDRKTKRAVVESLTKAYFDQRDAKEMRRTFAATSQFLAEVNLVCDKYADIVMEKAKEKCEQCDKDKIDSDDVFKIEAPDKKAFYDDIDAVNADELTFTIRNRVMDAAQNFIDSYNRDKTELKSILKDTSDTVKFLKEGSNLVDYYEKKAVMKSKTITNKTYTPVFEAMVLGFSKSVYKNKALSESFMVSETELDTDSIREHCEVMYSFLEMLNTTKIETNPEEFLAKQMFDIANIE